MFGFGFGFGLGLGLGLPWPGAVVGRRIDVGALGATNVPPGDATQVVGRVGRRDMRQVVEAVEGRERRDQVAAHELGAELLYPRLDDLLEQPRHMYPALVRSA